MIIFVELLLIIDGQTANAKTFSLTDVPVAENVLAELPYRQVLEDRIGASVEAYSASATHNKLVSSQLHPFVGAVYASFRDHRPLILSPDMVWLLVCQGFAEHVNHNAEELRSQFVNFEGKKLLQVRRDDFVKGSLDNPWEEVFPAFTEQIRESVGEKLHQLIIANFSTTGVIEKAAFEITLMDAMKHYFRYEVMTLCGIPSITLKGTTEDWLALLVKVKQLRQYELAWWIDELIPILNQFVNASQGTVDHAFWESIFKYIPPAGMSGAVPSINGWIIKFFPYVPYQNSTHKNQYLHQPPNEKTGLDFQDFSDGLARAKFVWKYLGKTFEMEFVAGFIGIVQEKKTKALRPEIGWAVREMTENRSSEEP
jgi:hypothetical protein